MTFRTLLRRLAQATCAVFLLLAAVALGTLALRRYRSETHGARPLAELVARGSPAERAAAVAVRNSLAASQARGVYPPWEWAAVRTISANGDTIIFRIYRRKDTRIYSLVTTPWITGGARYWVSGHRLLNAGVGVR